MKNDNSTVRIFPWLEHPFRLISWFVMLEFSASEFYEIGQLIEMMILAAKDYDHKDKIGSTKSIQETLNKIEKLCAGISLESSSRLAATLVKQIDVDTEVGTLRAYIQSLDWVIFGEVKKELFLWISPDHAKYYSKSAEELLGAECLSRFSNSRIDREATEALKCYAVDRFTSCAFHLMRVTEAGLRAFGTAIGYVPKSGNWNWGEVFKEFDRQLGLSAKERPIHWQTHGDFLEDIGGDLRAVQKAWRNRVSHLDASYNEPEAEYLLRIIPVFMRHLANRVDETGKLYP